ncbi:MAG: HEAT repeat domain-containing protein [Tatlockia sp.]|nr:HEAT repeat domain-containing protein [Tatlockia sp.]
MAKREILVKQILNVYFKKKEPLSEKSVSLLKKSINRVLINLENIEKQHCQSEHLNSCREILSDLVLKPMAREWATSRFWYKRFDATVCYSYGFDPEDEKNLIRLLQDPSVLIALNVAQTALKFNHPMLINEMITNFSKKRRLQQSLILDSLPKKNTTIATIILERLEYEQELYIRIFCYRLLSKSSLQNIPSFVKEDINFDSIDLKIAILGYLHPFEDRIKNELVFSLADDPNWPVRAAVAKALATIHTERSIEVLTEMLQAPDWWVRHNAAYSLYEQGEKGIETLHKQSPDKDKFAYETAQAVLIERNSLC